ncbi:MAG: ATP-binding protein [Pseudomonadota bacterium]
MPNGLFDREADRLSALRALNILDSPPDPLFDRLTQMTARLFGVDVACITLVDEHRFFFKSAEGVAIRELPRETGFCDVTVDNGALRVVSDTTADPTTQNHSLVKAPPHMRFYAGAPLITRDGFSIGTLCLLHGEPREMPGPDRRLLEELASYLIFQVEADADRRVEESRQEEHQRSQKLESLGLLAGGIAHDFNNCLMGILGNASLAAEQVRDSEPAHETIENIMQAAQQASELTSQLLSYAGKGTSETVTVSLGRLVSDVGKLVRSALPSNVRLIIRGEDGPGNVLADPTQLRQVLLNLVINAAESYGDRCGDVDVAMTFDSGTSEMVVTVRDHGSGMDEDTVASLFDPFFSTKFAGRGLGMAIVQRIVHRHEATIAVDSTPGHGTTMTLRLARVSTHSDSALPDAGRRPVLGSGRILVIDDESGVRLYLERAAHQLGYETLLASSGTEALAMLETHAVALVLIDASMPEMSGEEVLSQIHQRQPELPAIVMSGHDRVNVSRRFKGLNVQAFLPKPFKIGELSDALAQVTQAEC